GHRQSEDGLGSVDGVTAGQGNAGGVADRPAAAHDLPGHFRRQHVDRPAEDGDGHQRIAAHGVDVTDGIGGGNAAEVEGVVDNRHEEVGSGYHAPFFIQGINRRIVAGGVAYPQPRIEVLRPTAGEDGFQYPGGNLAATAGSMAVLG